jgi:hypothetical protein
MLQTYNYIWEHKRVKFGIVFIGGSAEIFNITFEAPDDDHIGRNM